MNVLLNQIFGKEKKSEIRSQKSFQSPSLGIIFSGVREICSPLTPLWSDCQSMVVLGGISILPALVQGLHTKFPPKWLCLVSQMRGKLCLAVCFVSFLSTGILCINLSFVLIPNLWDNIEKIALAVWKCQLWSFDWWVWSNLLTHIDIVQRPRVLVSSPLSKRWIAQYYLKAPGLCMESLNRLAYLFFFFKLDFCPNLQSCFRFQF